MLLGGLEQASLPRAVLLGGQAEEETGPTTVLSGALVDGAIIKVNFKWRGRDSGDYVQGVYNVSSGTFTVTKGGDHWGRIVEQGTHQELIALNGYYKRLNDMQAL